MTSGATWDAISPRSQLTPPSPERRIVPNSPTIQHASPLRAGSSRPAARRLAGPEHVPLPAAIRRSSSGRASPLRRRRPWLPTASARCASSACTARSDARSSARGWLCTCPAFPRVARGEDHAEAAHREAVARDRPSRRSGAQCRSTRGRAPRSGRRPRSARPRRARRPRRHDPRRRSRRRRDRRRVRRAGAAAGSVPDTRAQ